MATVSTQGTGKGFLDRAYPQFGSAVPVLSSFYFAFNFGQTGDTDNHVQSLLLLPGGPSLDLTPGADLNPSQVADGRIEVMLADRDSSSSRDDYHFRSAHALLPRASRFQVRDVGCTGRCRQTLPASVFGPLGSPFPSVLALAGFKLFFTGDRDHHVDEIGVFFEGRDLVVVFNDRNDDDVFGYLVDFVRISPLGQNVVTGSSSGTTANGSEFPLPIPPGADWVLRGFHFDFNSADHHLRDLGVLREGGQLKVIYADRNGDDAFRWRVDWAHVSPQVVLG